MRPVTSHSWAPQTDIGAVGPTRQALSRFLEDFGLSEAAEEPERVEGVGCVELRLEKAGRSLSVLAFDSVHASGMSYVIGLLDHLTQKGLACPHALRASSGDTILPLGDGSGALLSLPRGEVGSGASAEACRELGAMLGRIHTAAADYAGHRRPLRGPRWWRDTIEHAQGMLAPEDLALLREEMKFQGLYRFVDLPKGAVQANPGLENVLFEGGRPTGLAGFGEACTGVLLFDVATAANAWCATDEGNLEPERLDALLAGYHAERPLQAIERGAWPVVVRAAALDSWLAALNLRGAQERERLSAGHRRALQGCIANELMLQLHWV